MATVVFHGSLFLRTNTMANTTTTTTGSVLGTHGAIASSTSATTDTDCRTAVLVQCLIQRTIGTVHVGDDRRIR
uniref:Putative secreted protein n=1 Tax=Anopheles marajoara TaxID=58244 RepID=A0A2M4CDN8_9DIPT